MAISIPFKFYRGLTDDYLLPNGRIVPAAQVRAAEQRMKDLIDASKGYDPYNSTNRGLH